MIGLNLLLFLVVYVHVLTSRANGAALSTIRPNLFVNFSSPYTSKNVKVSLKLPAETGMVTQQHEPLALLPNYYSKQGRAMDIKLNDSPEEDSAAEVTDRDPIRISNSFTNSRDPNEPLIAEFSNAERIDAVSNDPHVRPNPSHVVSGEMDYRSSEDVNFWIPPSNSDNDFKNESIALEDNPLVSNYTNDFPDYSDGNDSENVAETEDDHNRYFVKVKQTKPRDAFVGLGFSSGPVHQSIEPQILITAADALPLAALSYKLGGPKPPDTFKNPVDDKLGSVVNFINFNPKESTEIGNVASAGAVEEADKELIAPTVMGVANGPASIIADVTNKYGSTDATSIPGMAGIDYPILGEVPITGFDCQKQRYKGFFADLETKCQAWHYCDFTDGHSTFLCPNGTLFSQVLLTCDWWFNVDCRQAQQLYVLNERLYRYIKAPKPSFPEDYHGPSVDDWLLEQLNLGLLPKMKKIVKDKIVIQQSN